MEPAKLGLTNYHGTAAWDDRAALGSGQRAVGMQLCDRLGDALHRVISAVPCAPGQGAGSRQPALRAHAQALRVSPVPALQRKRGAEMSRALQPLPLAHRHSNLNFHRCTQKMGCILYKKHLSTEHGE